jgi:hypothetical protein
MLKNSVEYERDISSAKFTAIFAISSDFLLDVSVGICRRALVDESGMIGTRGCTVGQKMVAVHGTLCTIPLRNSSQ